jgi:L-ascorbate metabolism protein UlaG (beta-lactamase superfamily)
MPHSRIGAIVLAGAALLAVQSPAARPDALQLRYIANAGLLLEIEGRRVLIDAPIRDGIPPYATSPPAERRALEQATAPYEAIDAILITHWHDDHFSAEAVAAHLTHNRRAVAISSPQVIDRVRAAAPDLPPSRLRAVLPAAGRAETVPIGDLPIRVLRIRHNPSRRFPEQHVGFLVGRATTVLHTGDADPAADYFGVLRTMPAIDLALLPFWYLVNDGNRALVRTVIAPRHIVAMHVPPEDVEDVRRTLAAANVDAVVPGLAGQDVKLQ